MFDHPIWIEMLNNERRQRLQHEVDNAVWLAGQHAPQLRLTWADRSLAYIGDILINLGTLMKSRRLPYRAHLEVE